jgi:hypothetical protein
MQAWCSAVDDELVSTGAVLEQHGEVPTFSLLLRTGYDRSSATEARIMSRLGRPHQDTSLSYEEVTYEEEVLGVGIHL